MTRIAPLSPEAPRAAPQTAAPAGVGPAPAAAASGAAAPVGAGAAADPANVGPNPAMRMDPELGLVVLEFRDAQGEVAASFPTNRELDAYRQAARTGAARPETPASAGGGGPRPDAPPPGAAAPRAASPGAPSPPPPAAAR